MVSVQPTHLEQRLIPGDIAKALDYSLKRWVALARFLADGQLPIDNNWIENQIRPIAIGRNNWLFAGSLRAGQRAAAVMSLIQSAKLNGHDPYAYLKDVLARLPTQKNNTIEELLCVKTNPQSYFLSLHGAMSVRCLLETRTPAQRASVKAVAMDMWPAFS